MSGHAADQTGRFMQAIAALSAAPDDVDVLGRPLQIIAEQEEPILSAILMEISETVLRRILVFRASEDAILKLDVMERRVLNVLACPDGMDITRKEADQSLSSSDAVQLLKILRKFSQSSDSVLVVSQLPPEKQSTIFEGVTLADLNAAMDANEMHSGVPDPLQQVLEVAKKHAIAYLCWSDTDEMCRWGSDTDCQALENTGVTRAPPGESPNSLAIWGSGQASPDTVLLAQWQGFRVLMLLPCDALDATFAQWHDFLFKAR